MGKFAPVAGDQVGELSAALDALGPSLRFLEGVGASFACAVATFQPRGDGIADASWSPDLLPTSHMVATVRPLRYRLAVDLWEGLRCINA